MAQDILAWMAKHEVVDQIVESRQAVRVYNKERCPLRRCWMMPYKVVVDPVRIGVTLPKCPTFQLGHGQDRKIASLEIRIESLPVVLHANSPLFRFDSYPVASS